MVSQTEEKEVEVVMNYVIKILPVAEDRRPNVHCHGTNRNLLTHVTGMPGGAPAVGLAQSRDSGNDSELLHLLHLLSAAVAPFSGRFTPGWPDGHPAGFMVPMSAKKRKCLSIVSLSQNPRTVSDWLCAHP